MPMRLFIVVFLLAAGFAGIFAADRVVTSLAVEIFNGTAKLFWAGGQWLSATTALTVETVIDDPAHQEAYPILR